MPHTPEPILVVRHDSWIRGQIRGLVLHMKAPVETAELLQVGLITLVQCALQRPADPGAGEPGFVAYSREQVMASMADEVRQMTHLSRLQRRRWTLLKLAREHLRLGLSSWGPVREPSLEELAVATGLSVMEVEALTRMAHIGPRSLVQASHELMMMRSLRPADERQQRQARQDTAWVLARLAHWWEACSTDHLQAMQHHFGVVRRHHGPAGSHAPQPPQPPQRRSHTAWFERVARGLFVKGLERRPRPGPCAACSLEELWPSRLDRLLGQPASPAPAGSMGQR